MRDEEEEFAGEIRMRADADQPFAPVNGESP